MDDEKRYKAAKKRVAEIRDFYTHLVAFIAVNSFLVAINIFVTGGFPWALFSIGGWGIGLAIHAWETFGVFGLLGNDWEARKIAEIMGEKPKRSHEEEFFEESAAE